MSSLLEMLSEQTGGDFNLDPTNKETIEHVLKKDQNNPNIRVLFVSACETCFQNKTIG